MKLKYPLEIINNLIKQKGLYARVIPFDGLDCFDLSVGSDVLFIRVLEGTITQLQYSSNEYINDYIKESAEYILKNWIAFNN